MRFHSSFERLVSLVLLLTVIALMAVVVRPEVAATAAEAVPDATSADTFNDAHFHLTNYVQEGIDVHQFLRIMGTRVGRSALFGIPLQQQWSYANSGDFAPTYYLQTDAPLYYYSFTDAYIAMAYRSLSKEEQARFDPMITGFDPADMYGVDHVRRVLRMFPGVFTGIGEFTIHKEFVSGKLPGETPSLTNPALDRILSFAEDSGLVALIHNDIDMPFAKQDTEPVYLSQMKALLKRHPKTSIIWAHVGLGRIEARDHRIESRLLFFAERAIRHRNEGVSERVVIQRRVALQVVRGCELAGVRMRPLLLQRNAEQRRSVDPRAHNLQERADVDALLHVVGEVEVRVVEVVN